MPFALNLLRHSIARRPDFSAGLTAAGFKVVEQLARPSPEDVVLCWNRSGGVHERAEVFERAGAHVLVTENGYLGKGWNGHEWFALARDHHAGAGQWKTEGDERWDGFGVELAAWKAGSEIVILEQRSIGEPDVRSPDGWAESMLRRIGGRIRRHPGMSAAAPIEDELEDAKCVVTWNSGAALKALAHGVPVFYECPTWIGRGAARPVSEWGNEPARDDAARLAMFRRLAWAMWTREEIRSGAPFKRLVQ